MSTSSSPTAPSSISLVSGLHCGGVYETRSRLISYKVVSPETDADSARVAKRIKADKDAFADMKSKQ
jgi:hypothetical protein